MNTELIIRAWKDPEFRASLSPAERSALPECPAGPAFTELNESELEDAVGGGALYQVDSECICSNFTAPGRWTTTRTITVLREDLLTQNQLAY